MLHLDCWSFAVVLGSEGKDRNESHTIVSSSAAVDDELSEPTKAVKGEAAEKWSSENPSNFGLGVFRVKRDSGFAGEGTYPEELADWECFPRLTTSDSSLHLEADHH